MVFKMNTEVNYSYPEALKHFRQTSNHVETFGSANSQISNELESLQFVTICMSIGTGYGELEIEFIKCCLPKLKKLIVVEKDPNCLRELKVNMESAFGDTIEIDYHEAKIEDFMNENRNLSSKIDLVLAFYVLYFLTSESRKNLFKLCFDQWLEPNKGMLIISNPSKKNIFITVFNKATEEMDSFPDAERMKNEIKELRLEVVAEKTYNYLFDFRKLNTGLYGMMNAINPDIAEEKIRKALEEVCSDGMGRGVCKLFVVQNRNSILNCG